MVWPDLIVGAAGANDLGTKAMRIESSVDVRELAALPRPGERVKVTAVHQSVRWNR